MTHRSPTCVRALFAFGPLSELDYKPLLPGASIYILSTTTSLNLKLLDDIYLLLHIKLTTILSDINMRSKFKDEHPFEKRKAEAERIRQKYADRIPVSNERLITLRFL